jgi:hypothetical protein
MAAYYSPNDNIAYEIIASVYANNMWKTEEDFIICQSGYNIVFQKKNDESFLFAINRHKTTNDLRVIKIDPYGYCVFCEHVDLGYCLKHEDITIDNVNKSHVEVFFNGTYGIVKINIDCDANNGDFLNTYTSSSLVMKVSQNTI